MKHWMIIAGVLVLAVAVAVGWWIRRSPEDAPVRGAVPGVHELMRNVDRYRDGPTRVKGVVSHLSADGQGITLIDVVDFEECGLCDCAPLKLPVRWSGNMPGLEETVLVEGEVQESEGGLIFAARHIERVDAHKEAPE